MTRLVSTLVHAFPWLLLLSTAIYVAKHPEIVDKWSNIFYRLAFWLGEKREKRIVSTDLDFRVTKIAKSINKDHNGILPFGLRIKWKDAKEVEAFVRKGNVVIVLNKKDNLDKNIIDACMAFVPKALLPKAENVVNEKIMKSIDLYVIKKILLTGQYTSAYNKFDREIIEPTVNKDPSLGQWLPSIHKMDEVGVFTRIMLAEFKVLGDLLYGTTEEKKYREETIRFATFLSNFSNRRPGDDTTKLNFLGGKIKIGLILVAKKATLRRAGIDAYTGRIKIYKDLGIQRIYIFSFAQLDEEMIYDKSGYVIDVKRKKSFKALSQIEDRCRELDYLKLFKKQKYYCRDSSGKMRSAKYYVYDVRP